MAIVLTGRAPSRFAFRLIKAPITLLKVSNEIRAALMQDSSSLHLTGVPNSIDTLAPNNRFVKAINTVPITPGIPYHSIIGDRGKGGDKDHTPPVSTDGVVPYWSSHFDGAQSELIAPRITAHQNPQAIAEVRRILRLHVEARERSIHNSDLPSTDTRRHSGSEGSDIEAPTWAMDDEDLFKVDGHTGKSWYND